jgi:glycosyltransferase involved in cell wall biosynthesis
MMKNNAIKKIAVILPAFNEELTVRLTIEGFHYYLPDAEIWVIDNCSDDRTSEISRSCLEELGCQGGVLYESRPGKGNAIRTGFSNIDADLYLLADADMTYPPQQAKELIALLVAHNADMVVGDRLSKGDYSRENKRMFHGFGNSLVRSLVNILFNANLHDIMSGYRVFTRRFVKNYPILVEGFEIETDMTLHALDKRFKIVEMPINYSDRPAGSFSKLSTLKDGIKVLRIISDILRYYRPLFFFFCVSTIFFFFGLLSGYPVIQEFVTTRRIEHIPLAILSVGLEVIAVIFLMIGLILDSIAHSNKEIFERNLLKNN